MSRKRLIALATFVGWEGYWLFRYATAPTPDYDMVRVGALLLGLPPMLIVFLAVLLIPFLRAFLKQRR